MTWVLEGDTYLPQPVRCYTKGLMISLQSKKTIESTVMPGVKFTVRTLNRIQRAKRDLPVMAARQRLAAILAEYYPLGEIPRDQLNPEQLSRIAALDVEHRMLFNDQITPVVVRGGLISIEGLEIDGATISVDSLLDSNGECEALIEEIYEACEGAAGLSANERKNSPSDITSSEPVELEAQTSSAAPAVN